MDYVDKRGAMDKPMDRRTLSTDLSTAPEESASLINIIHRHDYYVL